MTTASPSTTSPPASAAPHTAPPGARARSTTAPCRSSAPCVSAARINPVVKARGSTSAVVSVVPSLPVIATVSASHDRPRARRRFAFDRVAAIGGQAAITPPIAERGGKLGMQREAAPRQSVERRAGAPVERQEAARFAGRRARDLVALDDDRLRTAPAREIGDRGADRAAAADHDAPARTHGAPCAARRDGQSIAHRRRPRRSTLSSDDGPCGWATSADFTLRN